MVTFFSNQSFYIEILTNAVLGCIIRHSLRVIIITHSGTSAVLFRFFSQKIDVISFSYDVDIFYSSLRYAIMFLASVSREYFSEIIS